MTKIEVKKIERIPDCKDDLCIKINDTCQVTLRTIKYLNTKSQKGKHPFDSKQWDRFMAEKINKLIPTYQFDIVIKKHPTRKFDLFFS